MSNESRHWRLRKQRYGLVGEACEEEGRPPHFIFPPRDVCPECNNEAKTPYSFSGKGKVYSHTTVYEAPASHEGSAPYVIALIVLAEGPMVTAQLTDLETESKEVSKFVDVGGGEKKEVVVLQSTPIINIDEEVEMVTRKLKGITDEDGALVYGYKFRPILGVSE